MSSLHHLSQKAPKKAKRRTAEGANSNVFSMFEQAQIQEFKEVRAPRLNFWVAVPHYSTQLPSQRPLWSRSYRSLHRGNMSTCLGPCLRSGCGETCGIAGMKYRRPASVIRDY